MRILLCPHDSGVPPRVVDANVARARQPGPKRVADVHLFIPFDLGLDLMPKLDPATQRRLPLLAPGQWVPEDEKWP